MTASHPIEDTYWLSLRRLGGILHRMKSRFICLAVVSAAVLASGLLVTSALAGGSWERVRVRELSRTTEIDYTLVVEPLSNNDPYFKACRRFEVHGTLSRLEGEWPIGRSGGPSRKDHIAALKYLQSFERTSKSVSFGWIGSGFRIVNPKQPCTVESRGLQITNGAVVSFFHMI
jgi:hypothetical protein